MKSILRTAVAGMALLFVSTTIAAAANLVAHVDVSSQTMTVSKNGFVVHRWKVSTARSGYVTPRGSYRVARMHKMWYSRKYDNAPMPYSVFFRGGYAIHGTTQTGRLGQPASHGCVRLHTANARQLFYLIRRYGPANSRIRITG